MTDADELIARYQLVPHPEGGHYRETWRDTPAVGRGSGTSIYYLLRAGEESRWHRIDAVEIWHHYSGAPLRLSIDDERPRLLGSDAPQMIVPAHAWQRACSTGDYSFVGCTVSPAFDFAAFELAPPGWQPPRRDGFHELDNAYELVRYAAGRPVEFASLSQQLPDAAEEAVLLARLAAFTGLHVRLVDWKLEAGDPRDSGRTARIEIIA